MIYHADPVTFAFLIMGADLSIKDASAAVGMSGQDIIEYLWHQCDAIDDVFHDLAPEQCLNVPTSSVAFKLGRWAMSYAVEQKQLPQGLELVAECKRLIAEYE